MFNFSISAEGNLVKWSDSEWQLENMVEEQSNLDVCGTKGIQHSVFPDLRGYEEMQTFCKALGGHITVVENQQMLDDLINLYQSVLPDSTYGKTSNSVSRVIATPTRSQSSKLSSLTSAKTAFPMPSLAPTS